MYQIDVDRSQELHLVSVERKAVASPLQQEPSDSVGDRISEAFWEEVTLEVSNQRNLTELTSEKKFEQFISNLLKYGVLLSSAIVLVGGILYLISHGTEPADYQFFLGEPAAFRSPKGVLTSVLSGNHTSIIQLGLLILIATPVARVAFSLLSFLWRQDFTYAILTLLVMAGLIYSFIGAYV
ncbi:MAG TPA: DUF1634 domain-containing protein [Cyanobacteria bacterium UBA8803]|nr:DUF1634 domain-containing protein [Cyanobacteria bacterium UBA9273]HBL59356.1 DUF1634 domain-containing protein [Cyanobacteria bacterium UBA8803]